MSKIIIKVGSDGQTLPIVSSMNFITPENCIFNARINCDILFHSLPSMLAVSLCHVDDRECWNRIRVTQDKYKQCVGVVLCPLKHKWFALNAEFPAGGIRLFRVLSEKDMVTTVNRIYQDMSKDKVSSRLMAQNKFFEDAKKNLCCGRQARTILATILRHLQTSQNETNAMIKRVPCLQYLIITGFKSLKDKSGLEFASRNVASFFNPVD